MDSVPSTGLFAALFAFFGLGWVHSADANVDAYYSHSSNRQIIFSHHSDSVLKSIGLIPFKTNGAGEELGGPNVWLFTCEDGFRLSLVPTCGRETPRTVRPICTKEFFFRSGLSPPWLLFV